MSKIMSKITAVEWYQKAIFEMLKHKENLSDEMFLQNMLNVYLRAKEMEKTQRKKDFTAGNDSACMEHEDIEDYFNQYIKPE